MTTGGRKLSSHSPVDSVRGYDVSANWYIIGSTAGWRDTLREIGYDMPTEERHRKLVEMADEEIDYSDIPSLDEEFWKNAELKHPEKKEGAHS